MIAALWLATRPYPGVIFDARFYMVQALRALSPSNFAHDFYFEFGSQGKFTVFTAFYSPIVAALGVAKGAMACAIVGALLWISGLGYLARGLFPKRWFLFVVAAVAVLPNTYSFFGYGESYVTPRLFAEALTLLALGYLTRGRTLSGLAVLVLAATVHPLMALPGIAFALLFLASEEPRWWGAIAFGAVGAVGFSLAGVQPFANLWVTYDPAWFAVVTVRDAFGFVTKWPPEAFVRTVGTAALAILEFGVADAGGRRVLGCALGVGGGGVLVTLLGADLAHNVFVTEVQPWRALWLLTVMGNAYIVPSLLRIHDRGASFDLVEVAFLAASGLLVVQGFVPDVVFAVAPLLAITAALGLWQLRVERPLPRPARYLGIATIAAAIGGASFVSFEYSVFLYQWPERFWRVVGSFLVVVAACGGTGLGLRPARLARQWAAPIAIAIVLVSAFRWDTRTSWTRFVESSRPAPASLALLLPAGKSVYWEGGVNMVWLRLRRASYFACAQGTGALFFRGTAMEFERRAGGLRRLGTLDFGRSGLCPNVTSSYRASLRRRDLAWVCTHDPHPDYLVLARPVGRVATRIWKPPVPRREAWVTHGRIVVRNFDRFYIYSCSDVATSAARDRIVAKGA